jgi:N-methylhydantoinase A/oxoprolinase/acetone carboxylase beta subunit
MILGIDVGGTHTDAVLIYNGDIISTAKVETSPNLIDSITNAVASLNADYGNIRRVVLSTTLTTNAIIENNLQKAGMIVSAGPGIHPGRFFSGDGFCLVHGAIDHRGREYIALDEREVSEAAAFLKSKGIEGLGIVSKFSVRNPAHEFRIKALAENSFEYISMGHQMNGSLNFPRRVNTTFVNIGVMPVQKNFVFSVRKAFAALGIRSRILFLKADGGTFSSLAAERLPVETIISGPAASVMGAFAMMPEQKCSAVMDIGGTTTDIGLLAGGAPVIEPDGINVRGLKTLVRGLKIVSVGAGGDSYVRIENGEIAVGPVRKGLPYCQGGQYATPMDALRLLGALNFGNLQRAYDAVKGIAEAMNMGVEETARKIIGQMVEKIMHAYMKFLQEVNSQPVYTIQQMVNPEPVTPDTIVLIGAPAAANAIGAAVSRTTAQITLQADTQHKRMVCPELDRDEAIPATFTPEDVKARGKQLIKENAVYLGLADSTDVDVVEEQCFNMVNGFWTVGKNMRLKLQTRPGIIYSLNKGGQ